MATEESLLEQLNQANALFNELRLKKDPPADPTALEEARNKLSDVKKSLGLLKGAKGDASKDSKKKERLLLKTAKGTRDYGPTEMFCRLHIEKIVKECFAMYGGSCIDTPVFERKDVLMDKYGEDSKLIFDLMDQGGEQLALRYDHTVPLARYLAMAGGTNTVSKLWQLSKVYRRDQPVMSKGRMREFTQADFDITGTWDPMVPDSEIISLLCTILSRLDVGEFTVKINHRKILDGIFELCGVPADKIRSISSAVDKLDKSPWSEVKREMTEEKGLDASVADKIGEYVKYKGGPDLLEQLNADAALTSNKSAKQGLEEMALLFKYLNAYGVVDKLSFDLSLARGLDYYTGIIYEAIVAASAPPGFKDADALAGASTDSSAPAPTPAPAKRSKKKATAAAADGEEEEIDESTVGVGSIAAGGRYDNLVSSFAASAAGDGKKVAQVPCVGIAIGMDRIFALLWPKWVERGMRKGEVMAYIMAAGDGLLEERMKLAQELRLSGINSDFLAKVKPKLPAQFAAGERDEIPFAIILGSDELKEGLVTVKEQRWEFKDGQKAKIESIDKGVKIKRSELVDWIKSTNTYKEWGTGRLI